MKRRAPVSRVLHVHPEELHAVAVAPCAAASNGVSVVAGLAPRCPDVHDERGALRAGPGAAWKPSASIGREGVGASWAAGSRSARVRRGDEALWLVRRTCTRRGVSTPRRRGPSADGRAMPRHHGRTDASDEEPPMPLTLDSPVAQIDRRLATRRTGRRRKGCPRRTRCSRSAFGIETVGELLHHYPRRYIDRSRVADDPRAEDRRVRDGDRDACARWRSARPATVRRW